MNATSRPPRPIGEHLAEASRAALERYYQQVEMLCGAYVWKHRKLGVLCQEQAKGATALYFAERHADGKLSPELLEHARRHAHQWRVQHPDVEPEDALMLFQPEPVGEHQLVYVVKVVAKSPELKERIAARAAHLRSLN